VRTNAVPATINELNNIPVKYANGATVYVKDLGHVRDGSLVQQNVVRSDGRRSVLLSVIKNGNASTVEVVRQVKEALKVARASAPPGMEIKELFDQSVFVSASVDSLLREGAIAAGLTALMILLFLGSWRSTLVVMISIPLSVLSSLVVLYFLGDTLNTMTLGGLALAIGILVDDSTVTIENTHRLRTEEGLNLAAAPEIVPSGSILGTLNGDLAQLPEFRDTKVIVPACHDTASAIAAIPATGNDWAFISSGTWSLVGAVLDSPCVSEAARSANFTNLGGVGGKICFLKNVNGMWLLRQCMDEWEKLGKRWSLPDLLAGCESLPAPRAVIDVDDPQLMLPGNTIGKLNTQLSRLGQPLLATDCSNVPAVANLVFHSLAARYAEVISSIAKITGKKLKRLFIVGGGNQNALLNRLTTERTGLEVILGSTESTTIGNFAIQIAALLGNSSPSTGVSAESVARWAERMMSQSLAPAGDREAQ